jgi:O-antigen/teichoic acid export membrane protein
MSFDIGRKDVFWNYAATFLQLGAALLLYPFILGSLPSETVAIWTIFATIAAFVYMLDFGFNPSFVRNVSYVFSGAKKLKSRGFFVVEEADITVDYGLLKGLIAVMRFFYSRMAIILFVVLITLGTWYIHTVLRTYAGNRIEVYIAWIIFCSINSYSFYTLYYDSLLLGKGLVKRTKQIDITGQMIYLIVAVVLILSGFGLIAIVSAQALSVIVRRLLTYRSFYTVEIRNNLQNTVKQSQKRDILKAIYPNAVKVGLTSVGSFLASRSAIIIGSLYLSLDVIASYGITIQVIGIIGGIGTVYFGTFQPKIMQCRIHNNNYEIKQIYLKACLFLIVSYIVFGAGLLCFGDWALNLIGSHTHLLHKSFIALALFTAFLDSNHALAGGILGTKNEVPFFKASLFAGGLTLLLLFLSFRFTNWGVLGMLLAPGIAQVCYQNWHWPAEVIKELKIGKNDICQMGLFYCQKLQKIIKSV